MMTFHRTALLALLLANSVPSAGAQPPSSTTTAFKPEIGYTYAGSNYCDLRLSNVEGTAAILVARTNKCAPAFDLAPDNVRMIAYIEAGTSVIGGALKLVQWSYDGTQVKIAALPPIDTGTGEVRAVEFSPDGSKLAMFTFDQYRSVPNQVIVHDFATGANRTILNGDPAYVLAWHPTLNVIYLRARPVNGSRRVARINVDSPADQVMVEVGDGYSEMDDIDTSRQFDSGEYRDGFVVSYRNAAGAMRTDFYSDDGINVLNKGVFKKTDGTDVPLYRGHFNCSNSEIVHRIYATRTSQVGIYNIASKQTRLFSSANLGTTDWMSCQYPAPL